MDVLHNAYNVDVNSWCALSMMFMNGDVKIDESCEMNVLNC